MLLSLLERGITVALTAALVREVYARREAEAWAARRVALGAGDIESWPRERLRELAVMTSTCGQALADAADDLTSVR